jgi:uncharacterized protein YjiK
MKNHIKIRYSERETGWAIKLRNGNYKINNIPLREDLNIHDIVTCVKKDGELIVAEIIKKKYKYKNVIKYDDERFFDYLQNIKEIKIEGYTEGVVAIAHNFEEDRLFMILNLYR